MLTCGLDHLHPYYTPLSLRVKGEVEGGVVSLWYCHS